MKSYLSSQNGLDLNENNNKTKLLVDNTSFLPFLEVLEQKKNLKINFSKHKKIIKFTLVIMIILKYVK